MRNKIVCGGGLHRAVNSLCISDISCDAADNRDKSKCLVSVIMTGPSVSIVLMEFEIIEFVNEVLYYANCGGM